MRLVDPVSGLVVEATSPLTITTLRYGLGYWSLDDEPNTYPQVDDRDTASHDHSAPGDGDE